MKVVFKTSHILVGIIALPIALSAGELQEQQASLSPIGEYKREQKAQRRKASAIAQEAKQDSPVALARAANLCTRVFDSESGSVRALAEGVTAETVNGVPLAEGGFICTDNGSTAIVRGGVAKDIRNVAGEDFQEYKELLELQR